MRSLLPLALALVLGLQTDAFAQSGGVGPGRGGDSGDLPPYCLGQPPAKQESDDVIYSMRQVTCRAAITSRAEPAMPLSARRKNVQGMVLLRVILTASGKVGDIEVVKGLPEGVTEEAVKAARQIKFRPAVKNDRRVSQRLTLQYNFSNY